MYWLENDCYQMIIAKQHNQETLKKMTKDLNQHLC